MQKNFGAENDLGTIEYLASIFKPEDDVLKKIRASSQEAGMPQIHVGPFDGRHLTTLARAFNAKKIVELGTLAGYSGTCLLRGGGADAKLYTFEFTPKHAEVARNNFDLAGVGRQAEIFIGAASDNLNKIESQGPFDLVFIDADKNNYPNYLDWAFKNLRAGGAVLADNTLAWGNLAYPERLEEQERKQIENLRKFNTLCADSNRWLSTMLPTGEGLTLAVKK